MNFFGKIKNLFSKQKASPDLEEKIKSVNDALRKINEGYNELVKLDVIRSKSKKRIVKNITAIAAVISVLFGYQQYLERNLETRIDNQEQIFLFAVNSLESKSDAVRATGVKTLENIAFTELLIEPQTGILSPLINLSNWLINKREFRFLERSRIVFINFAQNPRKEVVSIYNPVSTSIIQTGLSWISYEEKNFSKSITDPSLWFFYKADLKKSNAPNKSFEYFWFGQVNFSNSHLSGCKFDKSYLEKANFFKNNLQATSFFEANMTKANFTESDLNFADISKVKGNGSIFQKANLTNAILDSSNFYNCNFQDAILRTTSLRNTDFKGSNMKNTEFLNADLENANFENCDLTGANFLHSRNFDKIKSFKGAILKNIKLDDKQELLVKTSIYEKN